MMVKKPALGRLGDQTASIAAAIAQMEGYNTAGTLAQRNNNPGNLRAVTGYTYPGQVGIDSRGFAIFDSADSGFAQLDKQIQINANLGLNLTQFFAGEPGVYPGYAPSADSNNPNAYAAFVSQQTGIPLDAPLNQVLAGTYAVGAAVPIGTDSAGNPCDPSIDADCTPTDSTSAGIFGDNTALIIAVGLAGLIGLYMAFGGRA